VQPDLVSNETENQCPQCGGVHLARHLVKSTFWHDDRLVLVEDIPAIVCADCGERFFDDATATLIDLMHGDGFPAERAMHHIEVPVFSFAQRVPSELLSRAEQEQ
jgi:YgiT-type zinc finger domain-containing protein